MNTQRRAWLVFALAAGLAPAAGAAAAAPLTPPARRLVQRVLATGDHQAAPFIVIDKQQARLWLFDARGALAGSTPVLLGLARGDHTVPGIGERPLRQVLPHERTTPAGRFVAEPGVNLGGEDIYWIDYDAAVSMHRVRATVSAERRLERLASPTAADNRISYGCINVPRAFYDRRIRPAFGSRGGVVYLLPERQAVDEVLAPGLR